MRTLTWQPRRGKTGAVVVVVGTEVASLGVDLQGVSRTSLAIGRFHSLRLTQKSQNEDDTRRAECSPVPSDSAVAMGAPKQTRNAPRHIEGREEQ